MNGECNSVQLPISLSSKLPANLPGQFSLSGQLLLQWAAATQKGLVKFLNKKTRPLSLLYLTQKCWFQDLNFSLLNLGVLGGVSSAVSGPFILRPHFWKSVEK
jgi:hypothetical protein